MAPDEASGDFLAEEERDLFEMANLYPRTTGLPVTIWVSPRGGPRHDVRIKVSPVAGDRMDISGAAIVAVRPKPALIYGHLPVNVERAALSWVELNADALIDYWDGRLDTLELGARLKRLDV